MTAASSPPPRDGRVCNDWCGPGSHHMPPCPAAPSEPPAEPEGYREAWNRWAAAVDAGADMDEQRPLWAAVNRTLDRAAQIATLTTGIAGPDCELHPAEAQQDDEHAFCCGEGEQFVQQAEALLSEHTDTDCDAAADAAAGMLTALLPVVLAYGDARAARAALAARPSADTEALRRVRELVDALEDEATDGSKSWGVLAAYEDAADRLRAALDGTQ